MLPGQLGQLDLELARGRFQQSLGQGLSRFRHGGVDRFILGPIVSSIVLVVSAVNKGVIVVITPIVSPVVGPVMGAIVCPVVVVLVRAEESARTPLF